MIDVDIINKALGQIREMLQGPESIALVTVRHDGRVRFEISVSGWTVTGVCSDLDPAGLHLEPGEALAKLEREWKGEST